MNMIHEKLSYDKDGTGTYNLVKMSVVNEVQELKSEVEINGRTLTEEYRNVFRMSVSRDYVNLKDLGEFKNEITRPSGLDVSMNGSPVFVRKGANYGDLLIVHERSYPVDEAGGKMSRVELEVTAATNWANLDWFRSQNNQNPIPWQSDDELLDWAIDEFDNDIEIEDDPDLDDIERFRNVVSASLSTKLSIVTNISPIAGGLFTDGEVEGGLNGGDVIDINDSIAFDDNLFLLIMGYELFPISGQGVNTIGLRKEVTAKSQYSAMDWGL
ncbi:MAG: hypothetical protein KAS32_29335 [Candidatus Peribacteraceae bacterium]|nr:hypothetical protein [Candidatus Peribacteraceae bacterium]